MAYVLYGVAAWLVVLIVIVACGHLIQASHRIAGVARRAIDGVEAPATTWAIRSSAVGGRPLGWQRSGWSLHRRHLAAVTVADPDRSLGAGRIRG